MIGAVDDAVREEDYARLLAFRTGLREFLAWSATRAAEQGLTPAQHQLMLAVRGHHDRRGPTIGEAAAYLLIRQHAAVGLANRVQELGLLERRRDTADARVVRLALTPEGARRIEALSSLHKAELGRLAPLLDAVGD
jgi:DNA-binding MarR family transcriptional regulator